MNENNKDISATIRRAERFQVILIGEGIIVGGIAGLVVLLYRILLENAGRWLQMILNFIEGRPLWILLWFGVLALLAILVAKLVDFEPLISGSGIPQLEGEMIGKINQTWWRVLPAKFVGGFLCILGGLALGREGPSIQLGAMVGKGASRYLDRGKTEERYLLTCGASAGLAAAFHAPLAGVMFSLEEVHRNFSVSVLLSVMSASLTADFLCTAVLGTDSVFQFTLTETLPLEYYGLLVLLGVVLGFLGVFYNWFTLKVQSLYSRIPGLSTAGKILIPFLLAGALGLAAPQLLGTGHSLVEELTAGGMAAGTMAFLLVGRFLFSAVSFGSGAPGGIFFPLLIIGAFIGGIFAQAGNWIFGIDLLYLNNFVLLAMAGYFTAIVRAPLTGIILIFEMTGTVSQLFSLAVVSICAYIVATLMRSKPIYESLLANLLKKRGEPLQESGEKVLREFVVSQGSDAAGKLVRELEWPRESLLVAVKRGDRELIPRGSTRLYPGDSLVVMADEYDTADVIGQMERLCSE
ncbi:ClC family H(+)/Cl(-) exchange transporter [Faecalicatena contorta]|uniref:ClC family H(+)/Cl(-) exchange transporter n=1 Tax=Faecalicatena contorta TaxID=39482 RepID=UPI001960B686|nr:ClC family H(+)/Cl(-) exchange transporter [Faecalicatena contorta]MBM6686027.1 ClC family H(+)/Cl(-) exchange transporter [Faecalicatena contorta]MBM6710951.1 ClC family H(+)/Cl(-) exchange transporter [Faecalicatena contorta]HIX98808.1 chloride channel protein [Candidatus Dorea intestinigallinarum]